MKWFRITTALFILGTLVMATSLAAVLILMCTNTANVKHMQSDPNYNGTLGIYIVIILIQFAFITLALYGLFLAYRNWQNNFQLDHSSRHRFVMWLTLWGLTSLVDMGVAVFAIVKGKDSQEKMAHLYELFARTSQDEVFITAFEKYQKDKRCCGVYGPDDWLMVQLRSGIGGGGGGGGFQSLDYGFRQNPSTGHCHLTPPTIPMGCGKKILAEVHLTLSLFSQLMIVETLVGIVTVCLAGYCFYYWLDKEVIVIPEDEVSNLVILEPESSTSTTYSPDRHNSPYLGPPSGDYPPLEHHSGSKSGGFSFVKSIHGSTTTTTKVHEITVTVIGPNGTQNPLEVPNETPSVARQTSTAARLSRAGPFDAYSRSESGVPVDLTSQIHPTPTTQQTVFIVNQSITAGSRTSHKVHSKNHMLHKQEAALGGKLLGEMHVDHSKDADPMNDKMDAAKGKKGHRTHHATIAIVRNKKAPKPKTFLTAMEDGPKAHHGQTGHLAEDIAEMTGNPEIIKNVLDDVVLPVEHNPEAIGKGGYLKSLAHKQKVEAIQAEKDKAVGGIEAQNILDNLLEPVAIAHANDRSLAEEERPLVQPHMASEVENHPDHNGYLASGSHNGQGHYLNSGSHENAHHINTGSHENAHYINTGAHQNAQYINTGSHENAHYINTGSHENAHYLNEEHQHDHYINAGSHENAHYINTGSHENAHYLNEEHRGSHQHAHYINAGSHENAHYLNEEHRGSHQHAHYINAGSHENAHYINTGSHENAHYLNEGHRGSHEHAHYINAGSHEHAHYLNEGHQGSHEHAHYLSTGGHPEHSRGGHEHAHYLSTGGHPEHDHGNHEHAHYLPNEGHLEHAHGSHEHAHYLEAGGHPEHDHGNHEHAHYLPTGGHPEHDHGNHEHAHYLPNEGHLEHAHGSHEHAHYLEAGGHHEHAHYLPTGGHPEHEHGNHEHAHYLPNEAHLHAHGSHEHAHYLEAGGHPEHHHGNHEHEAPHEEHHEHAHGNHEHAHHLPHEGHPEHDHGNHEHAHYLPPGENAEHDHANHENAHYLAAGGHPEHSHGQENPAEEHSLSTGEHEHSEQHSLAVNRMGEHHHLHKSQYESHAYANRTRTKRFFSAKTEIIYKNPKPMDSD